MEVKIGVKNVTRELSIDTTLDVDGIDAAITAALQEGGVLTLEGWVGAVDGSKVIRATSSGDPAECADLGAELAADMLAQGAAALIDAARP